ncbi:5297_t:CDS:2, partial [Ambispora leptoticha]
MLLQAPFDIAIKIIDLLSPKDLVALSQTCKAYYAIVQKYGWKHYYKEQKWNLLTKDEKNEQQDWQAKVAFGVTTHKNWARKEFSTTIISSQRQSYLPTLRFDHEKLVCSVGSTLDIFDFTSSNSRKKKNGQPQKINKLKSFTAHQLDITDIALCSDYNELFTCSMDHTIKRWFLDQSIISQIPLAQAYYGHNAPVHSIFQFPYDSSTLFSVSFDGKLCVWDTDTAEICYSTQIPGIPRAMRGLPNNLIGVGNKSTEHLTLYKVTPSELVRVTSVKGHKSTVYALKSTDLFPHTFLSGCYDSISRLYDLRNNSCVASFKDPFDTNP